MAAKDGYKKLYRGVKSQVDKWADDELEAVCRLAEGDTQPTPRSVEIIQAGATWQGRINQGMKKG